MDKKIGTILIWTLIFYFIFSPLRDFASAGDVEEFFQLFTTSRGLLLFFSTYFAFACYTIGAYFILIYTYQKRNWWIIIFLLMAMVPLAISFRYLLQEVLFDIFFGFTNYYRDPSFHYYFFDNLYYAFLFTCFGVIVFFIRYTRHKEWQAAQYEIENQKSQLSLLRSQINPHFIFNALNGIYALVHDKNEKALPAIERLSKLLRYSLYEKEEQVNLKKEWQFIENYIELQSTRIGAPVSILMDVPQVLPNIKILPFTLIPFVENAFKHGDPRNFDDPIRIKVSTSDQHFIFKIENNIKQQEKDEIGGIGLVNTNKRLDLYYDKAHELDIEVTAGIFKVELKIPLTLC